MARSRVRARELLLEMRPVERARVGVHARHAHHHAPLGREARPRRDVRVMIHLRDDDLVTWREGRGEGAREREGEGGHVRAERDLVRRGVQQVRGGRAGRVDDLVGLEARWVRPVRVRVVVQQVVAHRIDDARRHLRSPRSVEVRHGMTSVHALERGEARANLIDARHARDVRLNRSGRHLISTPAHCSMRRTAST